MPRKPINYDNTIFYKIVCKDLDVPDCYVGHTTNFKNRKCSHKGRCDNPTSDKHHYKLYETIRKNGGWANWDMVMIEQRDCSSNLEALAIERQHYETLHASLNHNTPSGTIAEWREANRGRLLRKHHCLCGGCCAFKHIARHKQSKQHVAWLAAQQDK